MLRYFKSSPLWLIGLFIIFAQGTAGVAAIQIEGWPQAALVIFVISYSSAVTAIFFIFLWFRPASFYGPAEFGDMSPHTYIQALRGIPEETATAVSRLSRAPSDEDALFQLMDNLIKDPVKQHIIFMKKNENVLDISDINEDGNSHKYEIITRSKGISVGLFSPGSFLHELRGTDLVSISGGRDKIFLTSTGGRFAEWLINHEKDAETFRSDKGSWGKEQNVMDVLKNKYATVDKR